MIRNLFSFAFCETLLPKFVLCLLFVSMKRQDTQIDQMVTALKLMELIPRAQLATQREKAVPED